MVRKMLSENVLLDLGKQRQLVQAAADSLTVDRNLNLLRLAAADAVGAPPAASTSRPSPTSATTTDDKGRYILRLEDEDTLHSVLRRPLRRARSRRPRPTTTAAPATVAPSQVSVDVYNGSGISGLAASRPPPTCRRGLHRAPDRQRRQHRLHGHRDPLRRRRRGAGHDPGRGDPRRDDVAGPTSPPAAPSSWSSVRTSTASARRSPPGSRPRRSPRARTRAPRPTPAASTDPGR